MTNPAISIFSRRPYPPWLPRMLRPASIPLDWTRTAAALIGMGLPQIIGTAVGHVAEALVLSTGALCATFSDLTASYRYRIRRVGLTVVTGGFGYALGAWALDPLLAALVVIAVSALSVLFSGWGDLWAAAGAQMLTFCIVASGHAVTSLALPVQIGCFMAGELLVLLAVMATWPLRRTAPSRVAVARIFDITRRMFEVSGRGAIAARKDLTSALNSAHDLLLSSFSATRSRAHDRLFMVLSHATGVVEVAVALAHAGVRPPDEARVALAEIARCVRTGELPAPCVPVTSEHPGVRALDRNISELIENWRRAKLDEQPMGIQRFEPGSRARIRIGNAALGRVSWTLMSRMVLCVTAAEVAGWLLGLEQSYWIAMTTALVLRPNSGSVFARIMLRAIGTVVGVLVAMLLLALVPMGWWTVVITAVIASLVPEALARNYGMFTMVVTVAVLMKMSQAEIFGSQLPAMRLVDSVLGCGIALTLGYLIWPSGRREALRRRFADVLDTVAEYVTQSLAGLPQGRLALQRRAYRELANLRAAVKQDLMEPAATSRVAEQWWPLIIVLERIVDGATERALLTEEVDDDRLEHTQRIVSTLRRAARQLRGSADVPPSSVLARLENVYADVVRSSTRGGRSRGRPPAVAPRPPRHPGSAATRERS